MGGRTIGFLGGVLLTGSLTYYTGEYIQKRSQFVSTQLRKADNVVNNRILSDKDIPKLEPIDNQVQYQSRTFGETAKDIWNDEVVLAVNWVYLINWYALALATDKKVNDLTTKIAETARK